jgi:hypothetical protein
LAFGQRCGIPRIGNRRLRRMQRIVASGMPNANSLSSGGGLLRIERIPSISRSLHQPVRFAWFAVGPKRPRSIVLRRRRLRFDVLPASTSRWPSPPFAGKADASVRSLYTNARN